MDVIAWLSFLFQIFAKVKDYFQIPREYLFFWAFCKNSLTFSELEDTLFLRFGKGCSFPAY